MIRAPATLAEIFATRDTGAAVAVAFGTMPPNDRVSIVDELAAGLSLAEREWIIARHFSRSALRRRRLLERGEAVRELVQHFDLVRSGRGMARAIRSALLRMSPNREPGDRRGEMLRRVLALNLGRVPTERVLRDALVGIRWPEISAGNRPGAALDSSAAPSKE